MVPPHKKLPFLLSRYLSFCKSTVFSLRNLSVDMSNPDFGFCAVPLVFGPTNAILEVFKGSFCDSRPGMMLLSFADALFPTQM